MTVEAGRGLTRDGRMFQKGFDPIWQSSLNQSAPNQFNLELFIENKIFICMVAYTLTVTFNNKAIMTPNVETNTAY